MKKKAPANICKCLLFLVGRVGFPSWRRVNELSTYSFTVMLPSPSRFPSCLLLFDPV